MQEAPIKVIEHPSLGPAVSGRALYPLITNSKAGRNIFSDWFRSNQKKFNLTQGKDFISTTVKLPEQVSNRPHLEFVVSLPTAMLLAEKAQAKRGLPVLHYLRYYGNPAKEPAQTNAGLQLAFPDHGIQEPMPQPTAVTYPTEAAPVTQPLSSDLPPVDETPIQKLLREVQELARKEEETKRAPAADAIRLDQLEQKVNLYTGKFDALVLLFQSAAATLKGFTPAGIEPMSTRAKVVRIVEAYAAARKLDHSQVWRWLYNQLKARCSFDVYAMGTDKKDPNYLDIVEAAGQIESLYTIARSTLSVTPPPVTQPPTA